MARRCWVSICAACLAATTAAQDWDRKISFTAAASRAAVLFPQLAKQTGIDLRTSPQTENQVLLIQVHDVTIRALMDRIAQVTNAAWTNEGHAHRLVRSHAIDKRLEAAEFNRRAALFQKCLDIEAEEGKRLGPWSAERARALAASVEHPTSDSNAISGGRPQDQVEAAKIRHQMPGWIAIRSLLAAIGARELASIRPRQRVVYGLHPTSTQLPFGAGAADIIDAFVSRQQQYLAASGVTYGGLPTTPPGNPALGVGQAVLVVSQMQVSAAGSTVYFLVSLTVADLNGDTLASESTTFLQRLPADGRQPKPDESGPISIGPLAREAADAMLGPQSSFRPGEMSFGFKMQGFPGLIHFYRKTDDAPKRQALSQDLRSRLLRPEAYDPLALTIGEPLAAAATSMQENLVADLPDYCFDGLLQQLNQPGTVVGAGDLVRLLCPRFGLETREEGGWLTILPRSPILADETQVNRSALGPLLRSIDEKKSVSLDDLAAFGLAQEKPARAQEIDGRWLLLADGSLGRQALSMLTNPDCLRIYGTLNTSQRAVIESSGTITLADLTLDQKRWLDDDVFNSTEGPLPAVSGADDRATTRALSPAGKTSLRFERTEMLPDGIRSNGWLRFANTIDSGFNLFDPASGESTFATPTDIAMRQFQKENLSLGSPLEYKTYQPETKSTLTLRFELAPGLEFSRTLEGATIEQRNEPVTYDGLPDDAKRQVSDLLQQIRNSPLAGMTFAQPGSGSGRTPPP